MNPLQGPQCGPHGQRAIRATEGAAGQSSASVASVTSEQVVSHSLSPMLPERGLHIAPSTRQGTNPSLFPGAPSRCSNLDKIQEVALLFSLN